MLPSYHPLPLQMLTIMPLLELAWPPLVQFVFEAHEYFSLDIDVFTSQA